MSVPKGASGVSRPRDGRKGSGARRGAARSRPAVTQGAARRVHLGPLTDFVGYLVRRAQIAVFTDFMDALREVDLKPTQFGVLTVIHYNPGLRPSEVCAALDIQKTNFVSLLNELERRALVVRRAAGSDRRSYALYLTSQGEALLRRGNALQVAIEAQYQAKLGKDGREEFLRLLHRFVEPG